MKKNILIIASAFNELIVKQLVQGCESELQDRGWKSEQFTTIWVPGAFETPGLAAQAARSGRYSAVIALGAVIRGETAHFDYVAGEAARGLMQVSITTGLPIIFGILTTDTAEQALARCGIKGPNKGRECAATALAMMATYQKLELHS